MDIVIHDGPVKKGKKKAQNLNVLDQPPKSNVVYVGRIPHGFYEKQMKSFFEQFGNISKLRISRNKKTGKSKHFGFIKFEVPEVAAIVAESMNNYLLMESMLQVKLVPVEKYHPNMWLGANRVYQPGKAALINRMRHNRVRNPVEQKRLIKGIVKKDKLRRQKLNAAGIDFDYPDIRSQIPKKPKKIVFAEEE
ncbi:nucleolar protein 15 [Marchantia polymorpha subsp. ruderalis]|uniref:RRM domain-containing protein n=2 Tax=Marchantia polymorpha TaxID=3197 RepID=A0A176WAU0_MARPO|nr:hypothetical protein AXG93_2789s1060 [Marchantia polymorpha subsp. ruderalis]PTQ37071.1 hypothetical protein MARPO_0059s0023 [Marchantia polymorpha]BBN14648.1 hypothetical protein Mp_6g13260 [Marchantia polymorpha subsp. ruderalis]|eukprot:PTQ37071.1 hypothetical protein MARPO_0059s0023 [Marchantia polymorpha]